MATYSKLPETIRMQDVYPFIRFAQTVNHFGSGYQLFASDVRIFYILDGVGSLEIGGKRYELTKNRMFLIQPHESYCFAAGTNIRMLAINFDFDYSRDTLTQVLPTAGEERLLPVVPWRPQIENCPQICGPMVLENGSRFWESLETIAEVFSQKQLYYKEEASCCLKQLLISLARLTDAPATGANRIVQSMIAYIHKHYAEAISVDDLARQFGYSEYHLNRLMRKFTGTTIHQYILNHRIYVAQKYLAESEEPIGRIVRRVGFSNFAYFSKYFARVTGYSPSTYRSLLSGMSSIQPDAQDQETGK